jgi:hypothetical protein
LKNEVAGQGVDAGGSVQRAIKITGNNRITNNKSGITAIRQRNNKKTYRTAKKKESQGKTTFATFYLSLYPI